MAICSCNVEVIVHDQCFFMDFDFVCGDEREYKNTIYPVIHSSAHGEHNGVNFESENHSVHKLHVL